MSKGKDKSYNIGWNAGFEEGKKHRHTAEVEALRATLERIRRIVEESGIRDGQTGRAILAALATQPTPEESSWQKLPQEQRDAISRMLATQRKEEENEPK